MAQTQTMPRARPRVYYGWWIVLAGIPPIAYTSAALFYGISAFFNPIVATFGWSRATTSTAFTIQRLVMGATSPFVGILLDRWGPRYVILAGLFLFGLGFMLLGAVQNLWMFYLLFVVIGLGFEAGGIFPINVTVGNWFARRRGLALATLSMGGALGGVLVPLIVWLISTVGWRWALVAIGAGMWAIGIPCALVMRRRPEDHGLTVDGGPVTKGPTASDLPAAKAEPSLSARQVLRTPAFWLFALATGAVQPLTSTLFVHQIPAMVSFGMTPQRAALVITASTLLGLAGRWSGGLLADRVPVRLVVFAACLLIGIAGLVFASLHTVWQSFLYAALYGIGFGLAEPTRTAFMAAYFGRRSLGTVAGLQGAVTSFGGLAGPVFAGWMVDVTDNYRTPFFILSIITLAALPALLVIRAPTGPRRPARTA
ncbi:MAG: MFS transporter [Chloroflexi bacterium]|nr:MFS transporter [Chloroflexota bacterium]